MQPVAPAPFPVGSTAWSAARGTRIRLLVAPVVLAALLGVAWIHVATGRVWATDLTLALLSGAAGFEMGRMLRLARAPQAVATLACLALGGIGLLAPEPDATRHLLRLCSVGGAFLLALSLAWDDMRPEAVDRIARCLLPVLFVGLLFTWMRELADGPAGARRLIYVALVAKASDMAGWLVGKPFGRHKLVPRVSPGKSWEGLAGGIAGSVLVAVTLAGPLGAPESVWSAGHRALYGVALALASVLAGILQSGWKRRLGTKDSSPLIPEMGGVLDMIDSLLLAAPVAAAWGFLARV